MILSSFWGIVCYIIRNVILLGSTTKKHYSVVVAAGCWRGMDPKGPSTQKLGTPPETNMETQKSPYKDYSPSKRGLHRFPC